MDISRFQEAISVLSERQTTGKRFLGVDCGYPDDTPKQAWVVFGLDTELIFDPNNNCWDTDHLKTMMQFEINEVELDMIQEFFDIKDYSESVRFNDPRIDQFIEHVRNVASI